MLTDARGTYENDNFSSGCMLMVQRKEFLVCILVLLGNKLS